jgi:hypothetical protein
MDPFVRRLVERLLDPGQPLSRNRHFHTFATPEGRRALVVSRRLRALQKAVLECAARGGTLEVRRDPATREVELELLQAGLRSRRVATLERQEYELLRRLPGVAERLDAAG